MIIDDQQNVDDYVAPTEDPEAGFEDEKKCVKKMREEYDAARKFDEDAREQYNKDRAYASGAALKHWASSANLIGSFIDILVSFLYARDPDITATASSTVGGVTQDAKDFAETASIVDSRLWKKGRMKKACRKQLRSTLSVGVGWLKIIMTHETRRDPLVQKKLNDLEDNMQRLQANQTELQEGELSADEIVVKLKEAEQLKISLQAQLEVVYRYGVAIDFVPAEDMQVSLDVNDLSDHLDADWNANEMYVLTSKLREKFPRLSAEDVKKATCYYQHKAKDGDNVGDGKEALRYSQAPSSGGDGKEPTFARVVELWDRRDLHINTMIDGLDKWAVEPYTPPYASTRFYPYFLLALFEVDGSRHPQSLTGRLIKLQDEYSHKRSNSRLATERSIPGIIFDSTGITSQDVKKIEGAVSQEYVGINPVKGDDLRKLFAEKPIAKVDPMIFDTRPVISDMERISGVQEAMSATVSVQKTATEAKIQDSGFASRSSTDRDTLEDMLGDAAEYTTELAIQAIPPEYVIRLAGEKAFWPYGMDAEDVLTLAELEIKAGSTGKPDEAELRQSWSVILPLIEKLMAAIQQDQMMGNIPLAEARRNLLVETLRRLDERIDIDAFIPQGTLPIMAGVPGVPGNETAPDDAAPPQAPETAADANTLV